MWILIECLLGIFTTASTNLIYATTVMALIALYHEDLVIQPWMTFVAYQILNIFTSGIVMFGNRFIPMINKFSRELQLALLSARCFIKGHVILCVLVADFPKWFTYSSHGLSQWSQ
jgi:hypothetical protein